MRIRTQKTQTEAILPISYEALELCGERSTGKVFKGLRRSMINHPLKVWLKEAGITKPITFHGFRHRVRCLYFMKARPVPTCMISAPDYICSAISILPMNSYWSTSGSSPEYDFEYDLLVNC
jgi:hypothetical protein